MFDGENIDVCIYHLCRNYALPIGQKHCREHRLERELAESRAERDYERRESASLARQLDRTDAMVARLEARIARALVPLAELEELLRMFYLDKERRRRLDLAVAVRSALQGDAGEGNDGR